MWCRSKQRILKRGISLMAEKPLKKSSTFLVIREMQIKMTLRFYLIPIRMANIKKKGQHMLARLWSKVNTPPLLVGL